LATVNGELRSLLIARRGWGDLGKVKKRRGVEEGVFPGHRRKKEKGRDTKVARGLVCTIEK